MLQPSHSPLQQQSFHLSKLPMLAFRRRKNPALLKYLPFCLFLDSMWQPLTLQFITMANVACTVNSALLHTVDGPVFGQQLVWNTNTVSKAAEDMSKARITPKKCRQKHVNHAVCYSQPPKWRRPSKLSDTASITAWTHRTSVVPNKWHPMDKSACLVN